MLRWTNVAEEDDTNKHRNKHTSKHTNEHTHIHAEKVNQGTLPSYAIRYEEAFFLGKRRNTAHRCALHAPLEKKCKLQLAAVLGDPKQLCKFAQHVAAPATSAASTWTPSPQVPSQTSLYINPFFPCPPRIKTLPKGTST